MHHIKAICIMTIMTLVLGCTPVHIDDLPKADRMRIMANADKETINGAFGLVLGDLFETKNATGLIKDNLDGYTFKPSMPYEDFSTYYLIRAPKSGIISEIHANSIKGSEDACMAKYETLRSIYFEKYKFIKQDRDGRYNNYSEFADNKFGYIRLGCVGFVDYRLTVEYGNHLNIKTAREERLAINKASKEKRGL